MNQTRFPGQIYAGDGRSLDRRRSDLTVGRLAQYPHRGVVRKRPDAEFVQVWCLADDASFYYAPMDILNETVELIRLGAALLLLSYSPEVLLDFREMMLASVRIGDAVSRRQVAA